MVIKRREPFVGHVIRRGESKEWISAGMILAYFSWSIFPHAAAQYFNLPEAGAAVILVLLILLGTHRVSTPVRLPFVGISGLFGVHLAISSMAAGEFVPVASMLVPAGLCLWMAVAPKSSNSHLLQAVKAWIVIVLVVQMIELGLGYYIFTYQHPMQGGLDTDFFSGPGGAIRAKAFFAGPLSAGVFAFFSFLILWREDHYFAWGALCLGIALLSGSRTSFLMLLIAMAIIFLASERTRDQRALTWHKIFALVLVTTALVWAASAVGFLARMEALLGLTSDSTVAARVFFWTEGLARISDYGWRSLILGEPGSFRKLNGNDAESGWLTIFLDTGMFGLLPALLALLLVAAAGRRAGRSVPRYFVLLVVVANGLQLFSVDQSGSTLFWLFIWAVQNRLQHSGAGCPVRAPYRRPTDRPFKVKSATLSS